jgi:hypothetical protein
MTIASANSSAQTRLKKWQATKFAILGLLALLVLFLIYNFSAIQGFARLGSHYAAHVTCSCRYIEGRDIESCAGDAEPGMELVSISDDPENQRVTASVLFLAKAAAERRGEFGCQQLNDREIDALD